MTNEIELISDGDGLAVIGETSLVETFLVSHRLQSTDLGLSRLGSVLSTGSAAAGAGSEITANSGRWVKLTEESAKAVKKYGLRENAKSGLKTGVLRGDKGRVKGFVEFAKGPGTLLTNPAILAGAAGIMAQVAMQQTMDEITQYLATIDEKVDDVLRAQKDAVLARMIGVGFVIEEALTLRESRGRVDEITWSKIQTTPATIAETQAYALRQLDALAEKLEGKAAITDLKKAAKRAEEGAQEWLAVLARCYQLQDAIAVLELDRVLDASPDELDGHRLGLKAAREDRLLLITRSTDRLIERLVAAAQRANAKVLLHPSKSRQIVQSGNHVGTAVGEFDRRVGIDRDTRALEARRWTEAATEVRDRALETGTDGVQAAARMSSKGFDRARSAGERASSRIVARGRRLRRDAKG